MVHKLGAGKLRFGVLSLLAVLVGSFAFADRTPFAHSQVSAAEPSDDAVTVAWSYLRGNTPGLGLRDDLSDLKVQKVVRSLSAEHVHFQQSVQGIPVYGGLITVHVDKQRKNPPSASNRYKKAVAIATTAPALTAESAIATAAQDVGTTGKLRRKATTELVVYPKGGAYFLAWNVKLASGKPLGDWDIFVDAANGATLGSYNRIRQDSYAPGRQ